MKKIFLIFLLTLLISDLAYGEWFSVGKSNSQRWSEVTLRDGKLTGRQLAVTSTDGQSELAVQFFPELGGLGMSVLFFDRPVISCRTEKDRELFDTFEITELLLNEKKLPGKQAGNFVAGCAEEKWVEHALLNNVAGNVAIIRAFLDTKEGSVRISTADGKFNHSYNVEGFRALERGSLTEYLHSKAYRMTKSMEHQ